MQAAEERMSSWDGAELFLVDLRGRLRSVSVHPGADGTLVFGAPVELNVDFLRERSLRYLFPDISTQAHLEHTVHLVASHRVRMEPTIRHRLQGIESVPQAFEITANKAKYQAINPAQVMMK